MKILLVKMLIKYIRAIEFSESIKEGGLKVLKKDNLREELGLMLDELKTKCFYVNQ